MDIKIDIKDDRLFTDVAGVVDRDDFEVEIKRIRKALGLNDNTSDDYFNSLPESKINKEVETSRKQLYLPIVFTEVIAAAALLNKIDNSDYSPAYLACKWDGETFDKEGNTPDETYSIILSPGARDVDVMKAYKQYRRELGNFKDIPQYKYIHQVWPVNKKKPSIRKHREWYLAYKAGKKIEDIARKEKNYHNSTIRKAVESYESFIRKVRTS